LTSASMARRFRGLSSIGRISHHDRRGTAHSERPDHDNPSRAMAMMSVNDPTKSTVELTTGIP
jgi:hypothetical protein